MTDNTASVMTGIKKTVTALLALSIAVAMLLTVTVSCVSEKKTEEKTEDNDNRIIAILSENDEKSLEQFLVRFVRGTGNGNMTAPIRWNPATIFFPSSSIRPPALTGRFIPMSLRRSALSRSRMIRGNGRMKPIAITHTTLKQWNLSPGKYSI